MTALHGAVGVDACEACGAVRAECDCGTLSRDLARQARALADAGMLAAREGLLHRARALIEQAAVLDAVGAAEWGTAGLCALATGDAEGAVRAWRAAEALQPGGPASAWIASAERGAIRRALDGYADAARAARESRLDDARAALESVRATLPEFVPAARLQGLVLAAQGDTAGARESWRAASRICRDDPDLLGLLAGSADLVAAAPEAAVVAAPMRSSLERTLTEAAELAPRAEAADAAAPASPRGRRADPTDLALDEEEVARVMNPEGLDPDALKELATVERRVLAGWEKIRTTTAEITNARPVEPGSGPRTLLRGRGRAITVGAVVLAAAAVVVAASAGRRTESTAAGGIARGADTAAARTARGPRTPPPPTPEEAAARALAAALGGNRDSLARAIASVGDARRSWPGAVQQRALQVTSEVGRERYRAGRAAMAAKKWNVAASELALAAAYGAFTPYHDSSYFYLLQVQAQRGDSAAAGETARELVRRYPSSELSAQPLVRRLSAPASAPAAVPAAKTAVKAP
jgi:tetratricopeptide (TPR) repeat protein